jgi:hypothetical protein
MSPAIPSLTVVTGFGLYILYLCCQFAVSSRFSFSWSPTYPEYFAISTRSPAKGALIHVHNINYVHAQPTVFAIHPRPHSVQDFDFLAMRGIPRIVAAVGTTVHIFTIGVDS